MIELLSILVETSGQYLPICPGYSLWRAKTRARVRLICERNNTLEMRPGAYRKRKSIVPRHDRRSVGKFFYFK